MDIIRVENEGYAQYEEMLLRRDKLRKEAYILQGRFMKEFGDLITAVFEKKISCIQKKKTIAFCQLAVNRGTSIDQSALQAYIQKEMAKYKWQLKQMIDENDAAHQMTEIPPEDVAKIKKIYHRLAKNLHPDINPKTNEIEGLQILWNMVVTAYRSNSLEDMEEAEILVNRALKEHHISGMTIEIPNLDEKIAKVKEDIRQIKSTNPYQYRYLLADRERMREQRESLRKELEEYEKYEKELDQIMEQLLGEGVKITWRMN
ncbi:MAG: hypothetical protein Q4B22_11920 [Eubacteriales bacterium]|nr:hypothetical protein [Eubacteriales bacterium]